LHGPQQVAIPQFRDEVAPLLHTAHQAATSILGVGLGRSYGDSGLNLGAAVVDATRLDRIIAFDPAQGILRAEAGMALGDILKLVVPRGWFLPTSPGTRFVTLGGAVANDVHGKNHHSRGTFGAWVRRIGLLRSDHGMVEVSQDQHPELFRATIGGLGLTGFILWVEFQLVHIASAWLEQETIPFERLSDFFSIAAQSEAFEHTVAWVDCTRGGKGLGRGLFHRANWAQDGRLAVHADQASFAMPVELPVWALNRFTLRAFNIFHYHANRFKPRHARLHYGPAIYPLDAIRNWNRLYGSRGFYQYQCVIPPAAAQDAVHELLRVIASSGMGSFLIVLKTFGARRSPGLLSFPHEGTTLALDFANHGEETLGLMARLDDIVMPAGGRLYPAKDGRIPPAMYRARYPNLDLFRHSIDPVFSSSFWQRISS
jgi:L-gulonolactone oxidase